MKWLEKVAPFHGVDGRDGEEYHHHRTGEDNGDAHLKRQLLGQQVTMPVKRTATPWKLGTDTLCRIRWSAQEEDSSQSSRCDLIVEMSEPFTLPIWLLILESKGVIGVLASLRYS